MLANRIPALRITRVGIQPLSDPAYMEMRYVIPVVSRSFSLWAPDIMYIIFYQNERHEL